MKRNQEKISAGSITLLILALINIAVFKLALCGNTSFLPVSWITLPILILSLLNAALIRWQVRKAHAVCDAEKTTVSVFEDVSENHLPAGELIGGVSFGETALKYRNLN